MKIKFLFIFLFSLIFLSGCIKPKTETEAKTSSEIAQEIIASAAGYCKGMAQQGADFNICFEKLTGDSIEKLEAKLKNENKSI